MKKSNIRSYHFSKISQWQKVPKSALLKHDSRIRENYSIRITDTRRKSVKNELIIHHRKTKGKKTYLTYKKWNSGRFIPIRK